MLREVKSEMPIELWNRIEEKLVFHPLGKKEVAGIAELLIAESSDRLFQERGIRYGFDSTLVAYLVANGGYDATLGARPMRHMVQRVVEGAIANAILHGRVHGGEGLLVRVEDDKVVVDVSQLP